MKSILTLLLCLSTHALAQPEPQPQPQAGEAPGSDAPVEMGFHLGNLLPNQIEGLTEIIGLGGVRGGYRLAPGGYVEGGLILGNGEGAQWKNAHLDLRMDIPVENLVGSAFIGADMIFYKGAGMSDKLIFGAHAGCAVQMPITGATWFRTDMKFGFNPGTSLYIGFGFVFRVGA